MQITHYLSPHEIIIPLVGTTKEAIYKELVKHLVIQHKLKDEERLFKAILDREASTTTFLPIGVAVPHARISNINDIVLVIGVSQSPIEDNITDGVPLTANVFCLFFSPTEEKEFGRHLKLLARIAAVFGDTELVSELSRMKSGDEVFERLQLREREISEE